MEKEEIRRLGNWKMISNMQEINHISDSDSVSVSKHLIGSLSDS